MLPVRSLSMALAGTDLAHHRAFVGAAEDYRRKMQRVLNNDIAQNARPGVAYTAGPELWSKVPEFDYALPGVGWVLAQNWPSVLLLVAWLALAISFAVSARVRPTAD
jgi:ABC-2 type transport system permease protein